jgi:protein-L-isoaspartate(D-aspartate) O-methyltransferase
MKLFPTFVFIAGFICGTLAGPISADESSDIRQARDDMVREQIENRGIKDPRVLSAMREVPRHLFVPQNLRSKAYTDRPLPIGDGQTISQPYIVALMTEVLSLTAASRVLEIGTGSGYQATVLAAVAGDVYTIEIKSKLYEQAARTLRGLQLDTVKTRLGDGYYGWSDQAPFDAIMITAAVDHIPPPLLRQLKDGGRLVLPLGNPFSYQNLVLVTKQAEDYTVKQITGVLFVPLTGYALDRKR